MKTVDVRLLVPDEVDEEYLVRQLVQATSGSGAPRGAVLVGLTDVGEDVDGVEPTGRVVTHLGFEWWNGEKLDSSATVTRRPSQVAQVQALAKRLYPTD